jgi:general secretion pathway protein C
VLADARFYPYREGGVVKGYLISQVRPSGVFYGMGMRSGDIILSVNDYVIDAPEKAMSLMKGLKGETNVKLDILRRGRAQTFKYEIR